MTAQDLKALARARLDSGDLPPCKPVRVLGSIGHGAKCAMCDTPIAAPEVEYEVELPGERRPEGWRFHIACFEAWRDLCDELDPPGLTPEPYPV